MGESARVTSVEALRGFVPAVVSFREDVQGGLLTADATAQRAVDWVRNDRLPYWKREVRKRQELVTRARSNFESKRPIHADDSRPNTDAQIALDKARRALADAEKKLAATGRWARVIEKAIEEYRGAVQGLSGLARSDMARATGALEAMASSLDEYLAVGGPDSGKPGPTLPEGDGDGSESEHADTGGTP
ncbi:MAG: hypothetical protein DHS20C14_18090 [Phycisphaeraceae bacterium]|nr:MAG: hypothetical protein DHS20C14_18090 [Phycisphaeraceae bacterium]